ncbi:MAG: class B sortase, partial [Oscillospiraceae bacterium]
APVKAYSDISYYKAHPLITFNTIYGKGVYKIIGAFTVDTTQIDGGFDYNNKIDLTSEELNEYVAEVTKRSYFNTEVDVKADDKLITLSTCNGYNATPMRSCVVARKVRPSETTEVDVSKATENTDMVMPDAWVKKNKKANQYQ